MICFKHESEDKSSGVHIITYPKLHLGMMYTACYCFSYGRKRVEEKIFKKIVPKQVSQNHLFSCIDLISSIRHSRSKSG